MSPRPQPPARAALQRLSAPRTSTASAAAASLPLLLRAPGIAALWALALLTTVAATALGRVRLPRLTPGVVVAVEPVADSLTLLLLLPASARAYVRPGQLAALDTGGVASLPLAVASIEPELLDARAARRRFGDPASLLAHLDTPKVVARLERCHAGRCLTPAPGASYAATAALGTRSLASYALPRS